MGERIVSGAGRLSAGRPSVALSPARRLLLLTAALLATALLPSRAGAEDETLVRVIAEQAAVRTGPGFAFRSVYVAERGEVLPVIERATAAHWFRVRLPDGTSGWLLGDQVFPLDIETAERQRGPSFWRRVADAVFSPSPLLESTVSVAFSAGFVSADSAFFVRPAWLVAPHLSLEGFVGESIGDQVDVIYFGGGPNVFVFPQSPVTPFLSATAGRARSGKKGDVFTLREDADSFTFLGAGGGLLVALKKRIVLRADARHYAIFDPNVTRRVQEYSGALSVYF